jgi:hypothetical protein
MTTTLLKSISITNEESESLDIFDLSIANIKRYDLLLNLDTTIQFETIKRLMDIYRLSRVKKLEKFFIQVCIFDRQISLYLKQEMLFNIFNQSTNNYTSNISLKKITHLNKKREIGIKQSFSNVIFLIVRKAFHHSEYWLLLEDVLLSYFKYTKFKYTKCFTLFKNIIILGFKKWADPFKKLFIFLRKLEIEDSVFKTLCTFIYIKYNHSLNIKNNLLLLQIIFEGENIFIDNLFHIASNDSIGLNLRLEACDILYLKGSRDVKLRVENILKLILPDTAYTQNPENVHIPSVLSSVDRTLKSLLIFNKGKEMPHSLHTTLLNIFNQNKEFHKIEGSLNRIFNYNFLKFSKYELTLKEIIENIWLVINSCSSLGQGEVTHEELKVQIYMRLEQELVDMYDTCSQGYVTRLINVFSGFELDGFDGGITISFEDEIYAIFSTKVNKLVECAPEPIKEKLLEELIVPSNLMENRLNLIRFLRPHLPQIWNEIFEIFKDQLTITDLDLYSRKVIMRYEGC